MKPPDDRPFGRAWEIDSGGEPQRDRSGRGRQRNGRRDRADDAAPVNRADRRMRIIAGRIADGRSVRGGSRRHLGGEDAGEGDLKDERVGRRDSDAKAQPAGS